MSDPDPLTVELVARTLERRHGNPVYRQAWKSFAKLLRRSPQILMDEQKKLIAEQEQITSISSRPV
jgi:hypothetical protein